ncbi:MAG: helicase-exonuclease AddAB subunit AddA, partial [Defluviitaleaceae bacterium]|nr:helicase-exonuclease AddAB subunit AddA [Defluviitaleaceae bacterium]
MEFTIDQQLAIDTLNKNLLVSAAAGSGKTAVLTARILGLIANDTQPVEVDRLLVLTFANAAAAEIRARLRAALSQRQRQNPADSNLRTQAALLNRAQISTIHTFAIYVIRRYFAIAGTDPFFKIADLSEMELLKREVMDQLMEDEYAAPNNTEFTAFVERYGGTRTDDKNVPEHVLALYTFAMNIPFYEKRLGQFADAYNSIEVGTLAGTRWYKASMESLRRSLESVRASLGQALAIAEMADGPNHYIPALEADEELLDRLANVPDLPPEEAYEQLANISFEPLSRKRPPCDPALRELAKGIRDDNFKKPLLNAAKAAMPKPPAEIVADLADLAPHVRTLCRLTLEFTRRFSAAKQSRNLLDFSDLEHTCLNLLVNQDTLEPTQAAAELRAHFEHIMIDEYQDSNRVQDLILQAVARDANRFMVGDVKQSIYRFRSADPSIFLEKYNGFQRTGTNIRIDLHNNFRSRPEILETANLIFRQIMSTASCGINYDDSAALVGATASAGSQGANPYQCEVLIGIPSANNQDDEDPEYTDTDTDEHDTHEDSAENLIEELRGAALEAEIVAARILSLVNGTDALEIFDKEKQTKRPATFSDIVILMRATKAAGEFAKVFARKGIPLDTGSFGGTSSLLDTIEVAILISFLCIIDNPRQDIQLVAVLSSPVYGLSPDELLEVRELRKNADFYDCVLEYAEHSTDKPFIKDEVLAAKLRAFLQELEELRNTAPYTSLSDLISELCERADYANMVSSMPMGNVRAANLRLFRERAAKYESARGLGLFHFLRFLEGLREMEKNLPVAQDTEGGGAVRLMSVHKSKGLEFPVVFVCRTSNKFNTDELKKDLLFHKELGIGAMLINPTKRTRAGTLSHSAVKTMARAEAIAEEMRMLYVAITRARDKLFLTGCVTKESDLTKHAASCLGRDIPIDAASVLAANSMLHWLLMSMGRHKQGAAFRTEELTPACQYIYNYPADFRVETWTPTKLSMMEAAEEEEAANRLEELRHPGQSQERQPNQPANTPDLSELANTLSWSYPHTGSTRIPSKLSITEIKRIFQAQTQDSYATPYTFEKFAYRRPDFLSQKKGPSPTEVGTIIHTVMEHMDLHAIHEEAHVQGLVDQLISRNILTPEEAQAVPVKIVASFAKSPLAMRMRAATELRKEVPFVLTVDASEIYGHITA